MESGKIAGIIIIILIILSIGVVCYQSLIKQEIEDVNYTEEIFKDSQIDTSIIESNSSNASLTNVNLNINQNVGGVEITFVDTDNVYNITSESDNEPNTKVTTNQNGSTLNVNVDANDSDVKIILSNKYVYNISGNVTVGGFEANITDNVNIDNMNIDVTLGGITFIFNQAHVNKLNTHITTGGINIEGQPIGQSILNSSIDVGGININLDNPIAHIFSNTKVGGTNANDYEQISTTEFKGSQFDSSDNKLTVYSNIQVGGLNI